MDRIPVNDTIIYSLVRLVDDAQKDRRDPSHSDLEFQINRAGLMHVDPNKDGSPVGKAKRLRIVLNWAMENDIAKAEKLIAGTISSVKGCGGFRTTSPNFVGADAIADLGSALRPEGIILGEDGSISPVALDNLSGRNLTQALRGYVDRAKKGIEDAALVVGTSKDLMEAVAAHVIQDLWGSYPSTANFPSLLGQAFVALDMATPEQKPVQGEHQRCRLERSLYETACSINNLRNKQGSGHGRPWVPDLRASEAKAAVEFIGAISELMLDNLERKKP
ncbi:abortive infection family protein [Vibrio parahaemolyticus]|uniref:abortive infection family protein n=1 Tax=Vibrio parahaemolyticus TaxID=670 RepID=UPI000C9A5F15|nr:abortive infection family protein [Vibrio parahaemolyticus]MDK9424791.1 abortive infection family protein [Vibrio parahaemolyticus]MDK9432754.1 abortive infection family protein [Vibrio parahaemolyticus]MDK9436358.1 abortive infection family protein [Vibrio parahaemolyticus]